VSQVQLYGEGKKGSKQVKAESLMDSGSEMKIISETTFLKMLSGKTVTASAGDTTSGCENLWNMVVADGEEDDPLRLLAIRYIRKHHKEIGEWLDSKPVEEGTEIPKEFLNFDRVFPLFFEKRTRLRAFAVELAEYELATWNPPAEKLLDLFENSVTIIREFFSKAILDKKVKENERYHLDSKIIPIQFVYRLCDSRDFFARDIGIQLIKKHPHLAIPEELFQLTESPDRKVRSFVIHTLWKLYRDKGISSTWEPPVTEGNEEERESAIFPVPEALPAHYEEMYKFIRKILFGIPPAKFPKGSNQRLKAIPARQAKLGLIETFRDIALMDQEFAKLTTPLLQEFMNSKGKSEKSACIVALTRIGKAYPSLNIWTKETA
jgi:hypothetical protein